jgi:hypothetical protein
MTFFLAVGGLFSVENTLFLVVVYKFRLDIGGHSACGRPHACRAITPEARSKGDRLQMMKPSRAAGNIGDSIR